MSSRNMTTTNGQALSIVAKCALCSTKTELFVCSHCDEVICQVCVNKHRTQMSETLKEHWLKCQMKYHHLCRFLSKTICLSLSGSEECFVVF